MESVTEAAQCRADAELSALFRAQPPTPHHATKVATFSGGHIQYGCSDVPKINLVHRIPLLYGAAFSDIHLFCVVVVVENNAVAALRFTSRNRLLARKLNHDTHLPSPNHHQPPPILTETRSIIQVSGLALSV